MANRSIVLALATVATLAMAGPAAAHISGFNFGASGGVVGPNRGGVTTVPWHRPPISQYGYHGRPGRGGPVIRRRK